MSGDDWRPARFAVYSVLTSGRHAGHRFRIGAARTIEKARDLIREDARALRADWSGGLIDWSASPVESRTYHIYESAGWDEVT